MNSLLLLASITTATEADRLNRNKEKVGLIVLFDLTIHPCESPGKEFTCDTRKNAEDAEDAEKAEL
jgi:hypothetical protein